MRLVEGQLSEINKEEHVNANLNDEMWVAIENYSSPSRIASQVHSVYRVTSPEKVLHDKLEQNHERMQAELLLAKNLQAN